MRFGRERLHPAMGRRTLDDFPVVGNLDCQFTREFVDQIGDIGVGGRLDGGRAGAHLAPVAIDRERGCLARILGLVLAVGLDANSGGRDYVGGEFGQRQLQRPGSDFSRSAGLIERIVGRLHRAGDERARDRKREVSRRRASPGRAKPPASDPTPHYHRLPEAHPTQMAPARPTRWYWFSSPSCDRRDSDLVRIESLSNSYHMLWCWDRSTPIGSFVPSKLIFAFAGRGRRPFSSE